MKVGVKPETGQKWRALKPLSGETEVLDTGSYLLSDEISYISEKFGPAPRSLESDDLARLMRPMPNFELPSTDALTCLWNDQLKLQTQGEIAAARLFLVSESFFYEGEADGPACALYTFDEYLWRQPSLLDDICTNLHRYCEESEDSGPPLGAWGGRAYYEVSDGARRPFGFQLPPSLSRGHVVYLTTIVIHREHLPNPWLSDLLLPLLATRDPKVTPATLLIPSYFWSPRLISLWA